MKLIGRVLCWVGLHTPDKHYTVTERRQRGKHKWHKNYVVCKRCRKRLYSFARGW